MEKSQPPYGEYPQPQPADVYPYPKPGESFTPPTFVPAAAPYVPPEYNWCEDAQRNKPQSNTLAAATFIFISGGMSMAWGFGFGPPYRTISEGAERHLRACWFIAVIIGAIVASVLVNRIQKRFFNIAASILVLVNGILFVSGPKSPTTAFLARYCDGIAFGLTIIPAIMAGSEQSVKRFRGLVLSVESIGLALGITIKTCCVTFWGRGWDFTTNHLHGCLAILYGALALLFAFIFTIESPTFFLRRGQETEALDSLRKLQQPQTVTPETYALLTENKLLLQEDDARGTAENIQLGLVPMAKLCIFRTLVSMTFSWPIFWTFLFASTAATGSNSMWPVYFLGFLRLMGTITAIFTLDTLGRKLPTAVAMVVCAGLAIGVGSIFSSDSNLTISNMEVVLGLMITYQFFAGLVAPASTTYLGEAFSISMKPYFVLAVVILENFVQIIMCTSFNVNNLNPVSGYSFALGVLQLLFALVIILAMPETKKTTLREALRKFKKVLRVRFG